MRQEAPLERLILHIPHSLNRLPKTRAGRASFTSEDDKLKAGQTREGVLNSEKSELALKTKNRPFYSRIVM